MRRDQNIAHCILKSSLIYKEYLGKLLYDADCNNILEGKKTVNNIKTFNVSSDEKSIQTHDGVWDISGDILKYHYDMLGTMGCFLNYSSEHSQRSDIPIQYLSWVGHDLLEQLEKQFNK